MKEIRNIPHLIPCAHRTHTLIPDRPIRNPIPIPPILHLINPNNPILTSKSLFKEPKLDILITNKSISIIIIATAFTLIDLSEPVIVHFVHH
jgi:hypothetical protein